VALSVISKEIAQTHVRECIGLIRDGRPEAARSMLSELAGLFPNDTTLLHAFGVSLSLTNDKNAAVEMFRRVIQLAPGNIEVPLHLAADLIHLNHIDDAMGILQRLLSTHPDNIGAAYLLATVLYGKGQYASSIALFDKVAASQQLPSDGWLKRGCALLALDRLELSLASFQRALELNPGSVEANGRLGQALRALDASGRTCHLMVQGGVGDFLQSVPFLLERKTSNLKLLVVSHFRRAGHLFSHLAIDVDKYFYFSTMEELRRIRASLGNLGGIVPCPRSWYFKESPFAPKELAFADSRPVLGMHLGGSEFSIAMQRQAGVVTKHLPVELLHRMLSSNRYNIILFGAPDEIRTLGAHETDRLKFACFDNIAESMCVVEQCDAFVGSDSAIKTLTAMLKVPTVVWLGDYADPFRDNVFIAPYVHGGVMQVYRYKKLSDDIEDGIRFTTAALSAFGVQ
jgi:tetratricopeptide (TPR) repeat protein